MTHIYGFKWTSVYGESPISSNEFTDVAETWASSLYGVTGAMIAIGLRGCIKSGEKWPPELPVFVSMCTGRTNNEFGCGYTPEYYRTKPEMRREKLLSSDERDAKREKIADYLAALRSTIKSK